MPRSIVLVLDGVGIGAAKDADDFGDAGSNTLGHIARWCADLSVGPERPNAGPIVLPNLAKLGLGKAAELVTGIDPLSDSGQNIVIQGAYGACHEQSKGKDTPSGHWEMMGLPNSKAWGFFPKELPCFPAKLLRDFEAKSGLPGTLGNKHASGTEIISEYGDEHIRSGKPIVYTSADSVIQIAAHEDFFGVSRLYEACEQMRLLADQLNICRVIARPFMGSNGSFKRTFNRKDYTTPPSGDTLLDHLTAAGRHVIAVGKIHDIFAGKGVGQSIKAAGNSKLFDATLQVMESAPDGSLLFTNFVDFDQEYGHRRNVAGFAAALEYFDRRLPELTDKMREDDTLVITADHGCDPTWPGSDHTRECVPFLISGAGIKQKTIGIRDTFADIGQTIARQFRLKPLKHGLAADVFAGRT